MVIEGLSVPRGTERLCRDVRLFGFGFAFVDQPAFAGRSPGECLGVQQIVSDCHDR